MKPNYVARKSAWSAVKAWHILLFFLVIPLVVMIFRIIAVTKYRLEFYDDKIIEHSGWLSTKDKTMVFNGVTSASLSKTVWGNLFDYGTVVVDAVGKWDIATDFIKNPEGLEAYLQGRIVKINMENQHIHMGM